MRVDTHEEKNVAVHMTVDELHKMLVKALTQRGTNLPRAEDFKTLELERHTDGYTLRGVLPPVNDSVERLVV
jgi:hypothetical protein